MFSNPRNISTLSDNDQALCEDLGTENEAFAVAKSPSTDGLTTEFLKYFWPELKTLIVGSFNYAFPNGSVLVDIPTTRHNFSYSQKKTKIKPFLKIGENIRLIQELMFYLEKEILLAWQFLWISGKPSIPLSGFTKRKL